MRWLLTILLLILTGLLQMALGSRLEWPEARGEFLFLIAFQTALHCPSGGVLPIFFFSGLVRDVFIGGRLGAGALLFLLAGVVLLFLRGKVEGHHVLVRAIYVFCSLWVMLLLLPLFEHTWAGWQTLSAASRDALYTALLSPLFLMILNKLPVTPRRDRDW